MLKCLLFSGLLVPSLANAQRDSLQSGAYEWKVPARAGRAINTTILFEGMVHDMQWIQMSSNRLTGVGDDSRQIVPADEEHLIIIRSGKLYITLADSTYTLGAGSVVSIMPGESLVLQNKDGKTSEFYTMKYRSKLGVDAERGKQAGGSRVINWDTVAYRTHDKGGRRNMFDRPTAMTRRFEMHVTTLNKGFKSHDPHTHAPEEIILVTEGTTSMQLRDTFYPGKPGTIYYAGTLVPHAITNTGSGQCTYFAFQFE
ncbi:MAG: cupin domain-containing protein [Chitinophagaceae bacterium]|nr:MAG: cupin domain-containing protein [Chitinophagaceae bacterium]